MITIGGTAVKTPQSFMADVDDVNNTENTSASGVTLIDRSAIKRVLNMEWGALTNAEMAAIMSIITAATFSVTYPDPVTGADKTITCYVYTRSAPMLKYTGSTPYWAGLSLTLKEQ